ncbi:MAG: VanZ family protein [Flavobacteriales bacterium]|nr:VanZ family protein [Flavobacteriales bacterium]
MKLLKWIPALMWVSIICWLSFSSLENVRVPNFFSADKVAHVIMYFILGAFLYFPLRRNRRHYFLMMFFALIFASLTEFIQHFLVVNRSGELGDFLANFLGLLLALVIGKRLQKT